MILASRRAPGWWDWGCRTEFSTVLGWRLAQARRLLGESKDKVCYLIGVQLRLEVNDAARNVILVSGGDLMYCRRSKSIVGQEVEYSQSHQIVAVTANNIKHQNAASFSPFCVDLLKADILRCENNDWSNASFIISELMKIRCLTCIYCKFSCGIQFPLIFSCHLSLLRLQNLTVQMAPSLNLVWISVRFSICSESLE